MIKQTTPEENIRCIAFMVVAMAGFAIEDAVIKQLSYTMPISQVLYSWNRWTVDVWNGSTKDRCASSDR